MRESVIITEDSLTYNPFRGPEIERVIYTTESQSEIWIACELGEKDANRAYNESISLVLKGNLNKNAILKAIQSLVDRHEALRAVFSTDGNFMTIFKTYDVAIDFRDISEFNHSEKTKTLGDYLKTDANFTFDLVKGPLFKVGLIKVSESEHQLILTAHHIICDGWSFGIILEELGSFYSANKQGVMADVPKPETYSSYAEDELDFINSEAYLNTEKYWLKQYETSIPTVTLPTDFPRPQLRTFKSNRLDFAIDSALVADLKKVGIQSGASFVVTLMAAFEVFLYSKTGQDDLVLGLPASGQSLTGKTQLVGHCVNLLPLRSRPTAEIPFNEYLKKRKAAIFDAYEHQQFSFGQLLQKLPIARDPSRVPLVPIMFNIDIGMANAVAFNGLSHKLKSNPRTFETFELFLNATGTVDELVLEWSYNASLFKSSTIEQMMASFKEVLFGVVENPSIEIGNFLKIDNSAYLELNDTLVSYPQLPLHELLAKQAQITPLKQAIKFDDSEISYENLVKQVNQLAHYLVAQGVGNGDFVAVSLPRSIELVVTLIAIMECGAAYLPMDPNYPTKRLEFMLEDSEAKYLITSKNLAPALSTSSDTLILEDIFLELSKHPNTPLNINADNSDLAYLLYTSGSTGKPKGVPVTHRNLVNFLYSMLEKPGIEETDKLLSITTISFDIAGLELFLPLLKGATLVFANDETAKDNRLMLELLEKENITMLQATPTTWQMLLDVGWEQALPIKALCGGEALPIGLAKKILARVNELWNVYGPTETTIWSAVKHISTTDDLITIGHPIANTQIFILNEQDQLVEPGKTGELCIAGDGVAKGYWKRPELTAEKFIKNPFESDLGPVLYRTGDLAKLLPSGEVQCLGRIDQQIKIRGHRIELGEIEQALDALVGVQSSVVLLNEDHLVANLIPSNMDNQNANKVSDWKEILRAQLPAHMVPQQFNLVKEFPTTLNGKIDRKALLNLLLSKTTKPSFAAPTTESEKIIAAIWQDCLRKSKIDISSDFFEIGGHSLLAVKIMSRIEKQTGNRLPLASLLEYPTISKLAAYMDKKFISWDSLVPLNTNGNKTPLFIVHGANYNILIFKELAENLADNQPVYALQAKGLNGEIEPHDSVEAMASHYISEILTVNPNGPYILAGFSMGGIIAFEMAKQLKSQGKKVKILALFDSYAYPHYHYSNPFLKKVVAMLYMIGQLFFMLFNMFSSKKNFVRRKDLLKLYFTGLYLRLKHGSEKQQQLQFKRSSKIDEKHELASLRYNLIPQEIKVDLFRSSKNIYFAHDYKYLGWKKIALKGIRKHMMPGNHSELFLSPVVEEFASKLQYVMDNYDSEK